MSGLRPEISCRLDTRDDLEEIARRLLEPQFEGETIDACYARVIFALNGVRVSFENENHFRKKTSKEGEE